MYGGFLPCTSSTSEEDEGLRVGDVLPTAAASLLCTLASLHPLQLPLRISRLQLLQSQWSLFFHLYCSQLCSVLCQVLNLEGAAAGCCAVLRWAPICSHFCCTCTLLRSCHVCCQVLLLRVLSSAATVEAPTFLLLPLPAPLPAPLFSPEIGRLEGCVHFCNQCGCQVLNWRAANWS